ncbi:MAG: M48 family metalloprotease [Gammaproteobacteria bacterium]|nr:M48 family metalloprotease [Gammaproteobacteria bacterium]
MELQRFRAKDMDYGKIVDERDDIRKYIATRGWGTVTREGEPLDRYLNQVLNKLIAVSPVPGVPARVVVIDLQHSPVAQATKDGTIYVPFKLLADMDANPRFSSEDALAFLLAHELSHILYYHFHSDAIGDTVEATKFGAELTYTALQLLGEATGKQTRLASMVQKVEGFYERVEVVQFLEESALTPAFTRKQEAEADLLAFDLMVKAGYNPDAAYDVIDLLRAYEEFAEARRKEAESAKEDPRDDQTDVYAILTQGITSALAAGLEGMKRGHASAADRRTALNEYHDRWADEVAYAEDVVLRKLGWQDQGAVDNVGDTDVDTMQGLFANYAAARNAEAAIAAGNHAEAAVLLEQALSDPTEFNAYPRIVAALHQEEKGDRSRTMEHVRAALQGPGPSFAVYERYLRLLGDEEERLVVLEEAEQAFGRFVRLMRMRATTLDNLGRKEEASQARSLCVSENMLSKQRSECDDRLEF